MAQRLPRLVDTPLPEIEDRDLLSLITEMENVTTVHPEDTYLLFGYLSQCLYPAGAGSRYEIEGGRIIPGGLLSRKISKLRDSLIYRVCDEIAQTHGLSAEAVENLSLRVFFNKYLPNFEKKAKKHRYDPRDWRG